MWSLSFFLKRRDTKHQKCNRGKHVWLIVRQLPMKAGWWDTPLALWDLAKTSPTISDNRLPLLTENNFHTPFYFNPPPVHWYLGYLTDPAPLPHPFYWDPRPSPNIWKWRLHLFETTKSPLCSYCDKYDETPIHLFSECDSTICLWLKLKKHFHCVLTFPVLTPQTTILDLFHDSTSNLRLVNDIMLLFKLYIYKSRNEHWLNINEQNF